MLGHECPLAILACPVFSDPCVLCKRMSYYIILGERGGHSLQQGRFE